jgi:hypothetical protein
MRFARRKTGDPEVQFLSAFLLAAVTAVAASATTACTLVIRSIRIRDFRGKGLTVYDASREHAGEYECQNSQHSISFGAFRRGDQEAKDESRQRAEHPPLDSNRSQSAIEPVSARAPNSCREKVRRRQRLGRDFWRRLPVPRDRDWPLSRLTRQTRGKLKTIPLAPGNRLCAGLRSGAGRTRTGNQPIMGPKLIISGGRRTIGPTIGRQDCGSMDRAPPAQAPSRWHHAGRSRR